jgi:hypothetical protein
MLIAIEERKIHSFVGAAWLIAIEEIKVFSSVGAAC